MNKHDKATGTINKWISQTDKTPELSFSMIFFGFSLLTVHPNETHVPKICLTVPLNSLDKLLGSITLATLTTWSNVKFPSCLIFLVFFLSLSFSPNSLINYGAALGRIDNVAALF